MVVSPELIKDDVTGVGYIQGNGKKNATETKPHASVDLTEEEFEKYYNVDSRELDPSKIMDDVFFILVPSENPDGRYDNLRTGGNGLDLNRDNTYATQPEIGDNPPHRYMEPAFLPRDSWILLAVSGRALLAHA